MARLILLVVVAAGAYWFLRSGRGSLDRLLPQLAIGLAVLYLISPVDFVPDAAGFVGLLDDAAVLIAAVVWARRHAGSSPSRARDTPRQPRASQPDPHEVLGVRRGASAEEITRAYREKMKLYHPDRVNGLGQELQDVATQKTIEIRHAYDTLRQSQ